MIYQGLHLNILIPNVEGVTHNQETNKDENHNDHILVGESLRALGLRAL